MSEQFQFPAIENALNEPNGLLAMGGDLHVDTLVDAYARGIFPWFDDDQPLLWWSPDPRAVITPQQLRVSKSLRKTMRANRWELSVNTDFEGVIHHCAEQRKNSDGTWITSEMISAYTALHHAGYAHSIEVWQTEENTGKTLVGGLYGVAIGSVFSGESMFHRVTNASKVALTAAVKHLDAINWQLLDCQVPHPHLTSMGATQLSRQQFASHLYEGIENTQGVQPSATLWTSLTWANSAELEQALR